MTTMNTLLPSLQHLTCCRLVTSIFNKLEVQKLIYRREYQTVNCKVIHAISCLTPCTKIQKKLEEFIGPLIQEIEDCLYFFRSTRSSTKVFNTEVVTVLFYVLEYIPQSWRSDGSIDREKLARFIVTKKDLYSVNVNSDNNRFIIACTFCFFSEALDAWNALSEVEKAFLKFVRSTTIVRLWIEWLESSSSQDWESFVAWCLGTPLWHSNVYILKCVLQTLSPEERSQYLLYALIEKEVDEDIMRFSMSVMRKDEQDLIFRKSTAEVFMSMLSWPLRTISFEIRDNLWPYLTENSYCKVLEKILRKIIDHNNAEFGIILIDFWAESPCHFQNAARDNYDLFSLVQCYVPGLDE